MPLETQPDATSTPNNTIKVKGRKSIHNTENSLKSPILNLEWNGKVLPSTRPMLESDRIERSTFSDGEYSSKQRSKDTHRSLSRSHEDLSYSGGDNNDNSYDSDNESRENTPEKPGEKPTDESSWLLNIFFSVVVVAVAIGAVLYFIDTGEADQNNLKNNPKSFDEKLNDLQKIFHNQEADFWLTMKVSIREISVLDQPRTVLLVYKKSAQKTVDNIINDVSKIAVCEITDCSKKPLVISGASLNTSEILEDYGKIISKYRDELSENGVMIIRNLEKVPATAAQAFHSFCDDYNPVVKHALILFTLNIDEFSDKSKMRNVEQYLLKLWSDMPLDDKFYPLFTRISSTILTVKPES